MADPRGQLIWHPVRVCEVSRPKVCVVENVANLYQRFRDVYDLLVSELQGLGYVVVNADMPLFNTKDHGVPQNRLKMYLVAIHQGRCGGADPCLRWQAPPPLPSCPRVRTFLLGDGPPLTPGSRQSHRARVLLKDYQLTRTQDVVLDVGASPKFAKATLNCCPCLTATRTASKQGFFAKTGDGRINACLSRNEKVRLQGYPHRLWHPTKARVSEAQFGHQMGNCISANVFMRLVPAILKASGVLSRRIRVRDYWAELVTVCEREGVACRL